MVVVIYSGENLEYIPKSVKNAGSTTGELDVRLWSDVKAWVTNTTECRRALISWIMDGEATTCASLPGAFLCDICNPNSLLQQRLARCYEYDDDLYLDLPTGSGTASSTSHATSNSDVPMEDAESAPEPEYPDNGMDDIIANLPLMADGSVMETPFSVGPQTHGST